MAARAVTRREADVLDALVDRSSNAEIAARLCLSERTVESHVSALLRKLGARDRAELSRLARHRADAAIRRGLPPMIEPLTRRGPLLGRSDGVARLLACWDRAVSVGWGVALVTGEAGIGKSSLAAHVATEINRRGGRVLFGSCSDGSQASYQPFVEPLTDDLLTISDAELRRRASGHEQGLARLIPDVGSRLSLAPARPIVDPLHERDAVQAALQAYVTKIAEAHPTLFVIEDLHWASDATRDVVARFARSPARTPLMILVTTRDSAPDLDAELEHFLGAMVSAPSVDVVALTGLDSVSTAELIAGIGSDLDAELALQETGGNPLFLREMATAGHASRTMRELVADRYARLTADDLDVLDAAVVVGEVFELTIVAEAVNRPPSLVVESLERAEAAGLVVDARPGRCAFVHAVFRAVRYETLTQGRRMRLHAAVARALEPRADDPRVIADLARHACIAFPIDRSVDAVEFARRAGDSAAAAADHVEAVGHYGRALEALDLLADPDEQVRLALTIRLGEGLVLTGDRRGRDMLLDAARSARRSGDARSLAEAICAIVPIPGMSTSFLHDDVPFRSLAEHALEVLPRADVTRRVRVLAVLGAQIEQGGNDVRLGMAMVRQAVDEARSLGDPVTLGRALLSFRFSGGPFDMAERTACGHELIALGDITGLEVFAYAGRQKLWWCAREMGDVDEMDRWYESAKQHVKGLDVEQLSHEATVALLRGDLDRAQDLTDDLAELAHGLRLDDLYGPMLRHVISDCRGRAPDVERMRRRTTTLQGRMGAFMRALLANSCARTGLLAEAQAMLDDAREAGFAEYSMCVEWSTIVAWWADTAALTGDVAASAELIDVMLPLAGRLADAGMVVTDSIDRVLALVMLTVSDVEGATDTARRAVAASRSRNMPIMLGRELLVLATARQRGGAGPDDVDALVAEALKIADRTGARIIDHDAELFNLATSTRPAPQPDHLGLTPREREVLELLATGADNRQIAAELDIAPSTVRKHLEHAYAKLHVSTRTGAVARIRQVAT